jgi:hypothetical protein
MQDSIERPDWGPAPSNEPIFVGGKTVTQTSAAPVADVHTADGIQADANADPSDQSNADSNAFHEQDAEGAQAASTELREVWGDNFSANLDSIKNLLRAAPKQLQEFLHSARYNDGRAIGNDPAVLKWLASLVPGKTQAGNQPGSGDIHAEIASIEAKMGTREYFRSEPMQARLRTLYAARDSQ